MPTIYVGGRGPYTQVPTLLVIIPHTWSVPNVRRNGRSIPISEGGSLYAAVPQSRQLSTAVAASTTSSIGGY